MYSRTSNTQASMVILQQQRHRRNPSWHPNSRQQAQHDLSVGQGVVDVAPRVGHCLQGAASACYRGRKGRRHQQQQQNHQE